MPKKWIPPLPGRTWYTTHEAAARLGMSHTSLHRHIVTGDIQAVLLPPAKNRVLDKAYVEALRKEMGLIDEPESKATTSSWPEMPELPPGARLTTVLER